MDILRSIAAIFILEFGFYYLRRFGISKDCIWVSALTSNLVIQRPTIMPSISARKNATDQSEEKILQIKLDKRVLAALRRESEARGGQQEHRITEEALVVYLGLQTLLRSVNLAGLSKIAINTGKARTYSRVVE